MLYEVITGLLKAILLGLVDRLHAGVLVEELQKERTRGFRRAPFLRQFQDLVGIPRLEFPVLGSQLRRPLGVLVLPTVDLDRGGGRVITSYSIHYTKLYDSLTRSYGLGFIPSLILAAVIIGLVSIRFERRS